MARIVYRNAKGAESIKIIDAMSPVITLGRHPDNTICVGQDGRVVSSRHGRFLLEDGNVFFEDLRSTNGSFVNRNRVQGRIQLQHDDLIHCGNIPFRFDQGKGQVLSPLPEVSNVKAGQGPQAPVKPGESPRTAALQQSSIVDILNELPPKPIAKPKADPPSHTPASAVQAVAPTPAPAKPKPKPKPKPKKAKQQTEGEGLVGRTLGRNFEITRVPGNGMMGTVYEANHAQLNRRCAVKVLREDLMSQPAMRERFRREANAIARLNHPNLVTVYDYDVEDDGTSYIVMEFIDSRMLDEFLPYTDLSLPVCLHIMLQLLAALAEAHRHGVVHRDLKPGNLAICHYVGQPYFVKVLDFGLAKLTEAEAQGGMQLTMAGEVLGTPLYMSPEQAIATDGITHATDIYAFGAMAYEMIAGKPPFDAPTSLAIMMQHVQGPILEVTPREGIQISPALAQVITRCLAKKPEERFPTAQDVMTALRNTPEVLRLWVHGSEIVFNNQVGASDDSSGVMGAAGGKVLGRMSDWFKR